MACYDFPEIVVHEKGGTCPRYNGGVCHPLPRPTPPYTEEEAEAVSSYEAFMAGMVEPQKIFHASGSTGALRRPRT